MHYVSYEVCYLFVYVWMLNQLSCLEYWYCYAISIFPVDFKPNSGFKLKHSQDS